MLQTMKNDGTSIHAGNTEIDQLLIDIILLLRVNLIELAKVADLCNDFRSKYIRKYRFCLFVIRKYQPTINWEYVDWFKMLLPPISNSIDYLHFIWID